MEWIWGFWFIILVMNIIAFITMGIDKYKARKGKWRVSERALFLLALIGGGLGILIGMYFFHHKTRHRKFTLGIPSIIAAQVALIFWIWESLILYF